VAKTRSTAHAEALLKAYRGRQILTGTMVAMQQCHARGSTTSSAVLDDMARRRLLDPRVKKFWVGMIFNRSLVFRAIAQDLPPLPAGSLAHAPRLLLVWELRPGVAFDASQYDWALREQYAALYEGDTLPAFLVRTRPGQSIAEIVLEQSVPVDAGGSWYVTFGDAIGDDAFDAEWRRSKVDWFELIEELTRIKAKDDEAALITAEAIVTKFMAKNY
jgi:hypothetical protein